MIAVREDIEKHACCEHKERIADKAIRPQPGKTLAHKGRRRGSRLIKGVGGVDLFSIWKKKRVGDRIIVEWVLCLIWG